MQISWHTGKESAGSSSGTSGNTNSSTSATKTAEHGVTPIGPDTIRPSPVHLQEEEVVASGWGGDGDGDDADGMGML